MQNIAGRACLAAAGLVTIVGCASMQPGPKEMTFFVTSAGPGKGGDWAASKGRIGTANRLRAPLAPAIAGHGPAFNRWNDAQRASTRVPRRMLRVQG